jgi:hypothetical protein
VEGAGFEPPVPRRERSEAFRERQPSWRRQKSVSKRWLIFRVPMVRTHFPPAESPRLVGFCHPASVICHIIRLKTGSSISNACAVISMPGVQNPHYSARCLRKAQRRQRLIGRRALDGHALSGNLCRCTGYIGIIERVC